MKKNSDTDSHGGEYVKNTTDFPDQTENYIYIDPALNMKLFKKYEKVEVYEGKDGKPTTEIENARFVGLSPKVIDIKTIPVYLNCSRESRFFHGIGHVLYRKNNEQSKVVEYDNSARRSMKTKNKRGKWKPDPQEPFFDFSNSHIDKP